ncbi:MAG: right-handed parallel beta-helix repeat-containing protein [Verrucomicrobiae bacterium]|nr:right-handed parallel beta-helix repeat-containing protein [Verrucomicrobiae bacterium]
MRKLRYFGLVVFVPALFWWAGCESGSREGTAGVGKLGPRAFFVAPQGNDAANGARPTVKGKDGPVATLERALELARQVRATNAGMPLRIYLASGTYRLTRPLVLKPTDSGLEIAALPGATPILSGGRPLSGWKAVTREGKNLWMLELPEVREGRWYFRQLWAGEQRLVRARHPNQGYFEIAAVPDAKPDSPWNVGQARFRVKAGEIQDWPTLKEGEVRAMTRWVESHLPVRAFEAANQELSFTKNSVFKLDPGDQYYLENTFETLDQPGEWYLEKASGRLYYWPRPGEQAEKFTAVAPVLSQVVRLEGASNQPLSRVAFRGLTFAHTEWYFPPGFDTGRDKVEVWPPPKASIGGFAQAAVGVSGAVWGEHVHVAVFEHCRFVHLGGYALELGRGCQDNTVRWCEMADLGAGGVKLGETALRTAEADMARGNVIADCHIHDGGQIFHSAIGIWLGQTPGNRLVHNHIHDFYYTGISIGWTWGYTRALATNNLVEFNHVHHIGRKSNGDGPILSDMGGIYTLGLHEGTVIRNNLWHDCYGRRYGGWGIYFDEGTTRIVAENNVVYHTTHGGFHQHYGRENVVRNNIFAFARDHQIQRSRNEPHLSFTFAHNLVLWKEGVALGGTWAGGPTNFLMVSNLYWRVDGGEIRFGKQTLSEWQQGGQDVGSVIADPLFVDPARGNFALKPGSPAARVGFQPFDLSKVGPQKP